MARGLKDVGIANIRPEPPAFFNMELEADAGLEPKAHEPARKDGVWPAAHPEIANLNMGEGMDPKREPARLIAAKAFTLYGLREEERGIRHLDAETVDAPIFIVEREAAAEIESIHLPSDHERAGAVEAERVFLDPLARRLIRARLSDS